MDISEQISSLLSSPDGMDKIKSLANELFSGEKTNEQPENKNPSNTFQNQISQNLPIGSLLENTENIQTAMRLMSILSNQKEDRRATLLLSLRPHLSKERQKRVDKAVSMLKIAALVPLLKNEGILENLL